LGRRLPELEAFELIGPGGMGTVYKARHRELDRPVAVKVLHAHLQDDDAFAERFVREARTLARLDHPNIVRVYDFGQREGIYYLVMEYVDGATLRQTTAAGGMAPRDALALVPRICEALQYAHDQGVVHRDIKPENILLDRAGAVKIADFGLAKLTGTSTGSRLTQSAMVMGTPHYMAPEQIEHPADVDHRADIYALGVVFYEMLTGELPVGRFPPPSQRVEVDVRLDEVVLRTLEKAPSLRYQQASELGTAVESLSDPDWTPTRRGSRQDASHSRGGDEARAEGRQDGEAMTPLAAWLFEMAGLDVEAQRAKAARHRKAKAERRRGRRRNRYEYRSKRTLWGWPLLHVVTSGNDSRMALARGIIAVGDVAIGGVAIGVFAFGGLTAGVSSIGLISFSGISLGLLLAFGGLAAGGVATGGLAVGLVATGGLGHSLLSLSPDAAQRVLVIGWVLGTAIVTAAVAAAAILWPKVSEPQVDE
jgi:predicted Ser/Thr protein kinase